MTATILRNARVMTMDDDRRTAEALAYRDGVLVAVGSEDDVVEAGGEEAVAHDLGGAWVTPGFVDAHHHVSIASLYGGLTKLTPPRVTDIPSLQKALAEAAEALPEGRWLVAMEWDEGLLAERRAPTRQELDDAVSDRPLFAMHQTCHRALANSRALELAGIDRHTPDPAGGKIERRRSEPTGLLIERGMSRVEALARPDLATHDREGYLKRMAEHYQAMVAAGITRVADLTVPLDLIPLYRASATRGEVLIPTLICPVSASGYLEEPWDVLDGPLTGEEDGLLEIGPVKLVFDGAPGCSMCLSIWQALGSLIRTATLSFSLQSLDPWRTSLSVKPRYGLKIRSGIAIYQQADANKVIGALAERGFAVATHAIGNAAIDVALDAYAATGQSLHKTMMPRLEHGAFASVEQVTKMANLGLAAVVQPAMFDMPMYAHAVSIPGLPFFSLRWMLEQGVCVAGSSDYPVYSFDPLLGIRCAIERKNRLGRTIEPDQCVTLDEAVAMYTRGAARACNALDVTGTIEVGKRADLVVLDGEWDAEPSAAATIVGGDIVHGSLS